jgi:hypothetical protein
MSKPRLLDLFCGAGGASMGYYRAGFEVIGVDIDPQPHYPFEFHQADAMEYPLEGFDAYHASPPCQAYTDNHSKKKDYPKLITPIRDRLKNNLYVIENVYKAPLKACLMLCGTMFGLKVLRHRYFEISAPYPLPLLMSPYTCAHNGTVANGDYIAVYTGGHHAPTLPNGERPFKKDADLETMLSAMGIDWMKTKYEVKESIPPAYTEYIGTYLIQVLKRGIDGR